jgi:cellulose synthase/poly-beta-1,6-N-acetylglucosamine synthase-like glycosyltransferase
MLYWIYILLIGSAALVQLLSILRGLYYLRIKFPRRLRPGFRRRREELGTPAPAVSVFVPCKGLAPELPAHIDAMLGQNYPDFRLFYITESDDDPAAPLLAAAAAANERFHHVIAGHTTRCCQKNHNLLNGIDYARRNNIAGDIYVFADMDICTAGDWLDHITLPLADRSVFAVSGFRSLVPESPRFSEHLHAAFNALQCLGMTENRFAAMWGGSMAVRRSDFEAYGVDEKWSTAIVDDMSLTAMIKAHDLRRVFSPDCLVDSSETFPQLNRVLDWLIRQTQYAAVYIRTYTAFGLCLNSMLLLGLIMTPAALVLALTGSVSWPFAALHMAVYAMTATSIGLLSRLGKHRRFEWRWLLYAPLFLLLGTYGGWVGFLSKRLVWADIVYHVNHRGEVLLVER